MKLDLSQRAKSKGWKKRIEMFKHDYLQELYLASSHCSEMLFFSARWLLQNAIQTTHLSFDSFDQDRLYHKFSWHLHKHRFSSSAARSPDLNNLFPLEKYFETFWSFYHYSKILERFHTWDKACISVQAAKGYSRGWTSTATEWSFPISVEFWRDCWCSVASDCISMKFPRNNRRRWYDKVTLEQLSFPIQPLYWVYWQEEITKWKCNFLPI